MSERRRQKKRREIIYLGSVRKFLPFLLVLSETSSALRAQTTLRRLAQLACQTEASLWRLLASSPSSNDQCQQGTLARFVWLNFEIESEK